MYEAKGAGRNGKFEGEGARQDEKVQGMGAGLDEMVQTGTKPIVLLKTESEDTKNGNIHAKMGIRKAEYEDDKVQGPERGWTIRCRARERGWTTGAQKSKIVFKPNPYCLPKCVILKNISDAVKCNFTKQTKISGQKDTEKQT